MSELIALVAGPTDKSKIFRFGSVIELEYGSFLEERGRVLADHVFQINIIPDEGVPLDIARHYKKAGGNLVVGFVPKGEYSFLSRYFSDCDRIEEFDAGWSGLNTCLSLKGDLVVAFGLSPGTIVEIAYTKFHNKYLDRPIPVLIDGVATRSNLPLELLDEVQPSYFSTPGELSSLLRDLRSRVKR